MDRGVAVIITVAVGIAALGLGTAVGFGAAVVFLGSDTIAAISADMESYEEYFDVTVLASEARDAGVYIRFENTGEGTVDDLYFEVEVRDADGRLVDEHQVNLMQQIPPGTVEEAILRPFDWDGEPVDLAGKQVDVAFAYGWLTVR